MTRLLKARIGRLIKQLSEYRKTLPLNDTPHQEYRNPGFELESPQNLQLSETINFFGLKTIQLNLKNKNEAEIYSKLKVDQNQLLIDQ